MPSRPARQAGVALHVALFWSLKLADHKRGATDLPGRQNEITRLWPETTPEVEHFRAAADLTLASYGQVTLKRPYGVRLGSSAMPPMPPARNSAGGTNPALLDAAALADVLRGASEVESALAAYAARRRAHVRFYQLASALLTPFFQSDSRLASLRGKRVRSGSASTAHLTMRALLAATLAIGLTVGAHAVDYRWKAAFGQGTVEATVRNANDSSVNIYCPSGQADTTPGMLIEVKKVRAKAGEQIDVQIVVDGRGYPFALSEIQFEARERTSMESLQRLVDALVKSRARSFTVKFPELGLEEAFSLLDARRVFKSARDFFDGCRAP